MAKWSSARWPQVEEKPTDFVVKAAGRVTRSFKPGSRAMWWRNNTTREDKYNDFIEAVSALFRQIDVYSSSKFKLTLEYKQEVIASVVPYIDPNDWEVFRVRFKTPPYLTKLLVSAIKEKRLPRLRQ